MMNICAKFHGNPSTKCRYIASCKISVNGQATDTAGQIMDRQLDGRLKNNASRRLMLWTTGFRNSWKKLTARA